MKKLLIAALLLFAYANASAQVQLYAVWDYPDAEIADVTRFDVRVDGGAYVSAGIPNPETLPDTMAGHKSFRYPLPPITNGTHSVAVRACNTLDCSFDVAAAFKLIGPPKNPRVTKGG